jgi:hypothetical protein
MFKQINFNNTLARSKVAPKVIVATLMLNVWTCLHGSNITSTTYNCPPPSLPEYLGSLSNYLT